MVIQHMARTMATSVRSWLRRLSEDEVDQRCLVRRQACWPRHVRVARGRIAVASLSSRPSDLPMAGLRSRVQLPVGYARLRQGSSRRRAPCHGERRSSPILESLIRRRFLPRAGPGAPSPSPAAPKLLDLVGTASGGCSLHGAVGYTERSAVIPVVSAPICVLNRHGAMRRGEPCRGAPPKNGAVSRRGALPRASPGPGA